MCVCCKFHEYEVLSKGGKCFLTVPRISDLKSKNIDLSTNIVCVPNERIVCLCLSLDVCEWVFVTHNTTPQNGNQLSAWKLCIWINSIRMLMIAFVRKEMGERKLPTWESCGLFRLYSKPSAKQMWISCASPIRRFDNSNNRNLFVVDLVLSGVHVRASNYDGFHCQPFVQLLLGRGNKKSEFFSLLLSITYTIMTLGFRFIHALALDWFHWIDSSAKRIFIVLQHFNRANTHKNSEAI